jgi:cystine transport system substrate-binding protein
MNCGIALKERFMIDAAGKGLAKRRTVCACLLSAWVSGSNLALAQEIKTMRVGFLKRYLPYSFEAENGKLQGFDVDVVEVVLNSLGIQMVAVPDLMPRLQEMLAKGEIDFIGNQLLHTPENRRLFDFVSPYASVQLVTVQHASDDRDFYSLDDMVGQKLGVLANSGVADQAVGALGRSVKTFEKIDQAFKALAAKEIDVVLEENLIAEYYIEHNGLPLRVGVPMTAPMRVGLAVSKGQKHRQEQLSAAVKNVLKDRAFKRVSTKWFGYDVSRPRVAHASS